LVLVTLPRCKTANASAIAIIVAFEYAECAGE